MEKRLLLSLALALVVLWVFNRFVIPPAPADEEPAVSAPLPRIETEPLRVPEVAAPEPAEGSEAEESVEARSSIQAESREQIRIETSVYVARLSNEGARLESLRLRNYEGVGGEMLELIGQEAAAKLGWPFAITTGDADIDEAIRTAWFVAEADPERVQFDMASEGLRVVKEFRFDPDRYGIEIRADVRLEGRPVPFQLTLQGSFGDQSTEYNPDLVNVVRREESGFRRFSASSIGQVGWWQRLRGSDLPPEAQLLPTTSIGVEDQYFLAMFLLPEASTPQVAVDSLITAADAEGSDELDQVPKVSVGYPDAPVSVFVGPKQPDRLEEFDPVLGSVIDYGIFGFFARAFLRALMWIHDHIVENYGWSIIILTIVVNLVFFPLRIKQQTSMSKMQKLGPQMRSLQDKMKKLKPNDPRRQELQVEMMGLYKKHGVNPLGGCLPLLLQMPFLFAMFSVLRTSIEMRQASWALWINDLSQPDPLVVVLPGLMGLSMFVMQKMTPTTADPSQARMMLIMPVVLPLMLLRMQSGLMLYWLTSNLVGIGQQYVIRKYWTPDAGPEPKKRAVAAQAEKTEPTTPPAGEGEANGSSQETETQGSKKRRQRRHKK